MTWLHVAELTANVPTCPLPPVSMEPTPVWAAFPRDAGAHLSQRYVPVTRTETLTFEQNEPKKRKITDSLSSAFVDLSCPIGLDVFCDWLTIYQDHDLRDENDDPICLPVLNDGYVVRFEPDAFRKSIDDETGEIRPMFDAMKAEYTVSRKMEHEGSYESKVSIRCDGRRVELSGNVGRFGRPDNVFGLPVLETIDRANETSPPLACPLLLHCPQCALRQNGQFCQLSDKNAVITRVDLTANFASGSREALLVS